MTCREWDALFERDPEDCTAAERRAFVNHQAHCPRCHARIEAATPHYEKIEREHPEYFEEIDRLCEKDKLDPEAQ